MLMYNENLAMHYIFLFPKYPVWFLYFEGISWNTEAHVEFNMVVLFISQLRFCIFVFVVIWRWFQHDYYTTF